MSVGTGAPIGKRYDGGHWSVDRAEFLAYASATDDRNPAYDVDDAVAPPMYHVRPLIGLMLGMAQDPELGIDLLRLVHGEHAMRFLEPLHHGDRLTLRGELLSVDAKASGTVYTFGLSASVAGVPTLEGQTTYFVRAPDGAGGTRSKTPAEEPPPCDWQLTQQVTDDQALRYAAASGDGNPIHTDEAVARAAGLPRPILHGLCTLALAARDLVNHYADGDPRGLQALSVRWARPVFPGDRLRLEVWEREPNALDFRTLGADGRPVLVAGKAELRSCSSW